MKLRVKIIAGARQEKIVGWLDGDLKIKITQSAEQGKANKAIIKLLSKVIGVNSPCIEIVSGITSVYKILHIKAVDDDFVKTRIAQVIGDN